MPEEMETQAQNSWKERRKQQLRDELVTVALELLAGPAGTLSVDEITVRAGIAKGTFYLYFKTKADIVQAALEHAIDQLEKLVAAAVEQSPEDARVSLKSAISAQLAFFEDNPGMAPLLLDGRGFADQELPADVRHALRERYTNATRTVCERIIRKGMLQTHYREVDARAAAITLQGMIAALADDATGSGGSLARVADTALELFEKGVRSREAF